MSDENNSKQESSQEFQRFDGLADKLFKVASSKPQKEIKQRKTKSKKTKKNEM